MYGIRINFKISPSNYSSVSTFTSPSFNSRNDEECFLQNPKDEKTNYSDFSITQARAVSCASDSIKTQIKLLGHKT